MIEERSDSTHNHCGLYFPEISKKLKIKDIELKSILNELYTEGFIKVRDGINGKLIFKNNHK